MLCTLTLWNTSSKVGRRSGASTQHCFITWMHTRGAISGAMFGRHRGGGFFTFFIISVAKRRIQSTIRDGGIWWGWKTWDFSCFLLIPSSMLLFFTLLWLCQTSLGISAFLCQESLGGFTRQAIQLPSCPWRARLQAIKWLDERSLCDRWVCVSLQAYI